MYDTLIIQTIYAYYFVYWLNIYKVLLYGANTTQYVDMQCDVHVSMHSYSAVLQTGSVGNKI